MVKVVEYDPRWPTMFQIEKQRILTLIGSNIEAIEHFGSTSVAGMCAKPCIDIVVGLKDMKNSAIVEKAVSRLGYDRLGGGENWSILGKPGSTSFRLHVLRYHGERWNGFLSFRDYLRIHRKIAIDYCRRKKRLAVIHRWDRRGYSRAKREFIDLVEDTARRESSSSRLIRRTAPSDASLVKRD
jgi:GrpB-like predicted nucleotidyltransferase (UPF0157 family)